MKINRLSCVGKALEMVSSFLVLTVHLAVYELNPNVVVQGVVVPTATDWVRSTSPKLTIKRPPAGMVRMIVSSNV